MGQVFDALTGRLLYQHRSPLNCATAFHKDGVLHALIGTYTGEGLVFALDTAHGLTLIASIPMHDNAIKGVAANDRHLFSVCAWPPWRCTTLTTSAARGMSSRRTLGSPSVAAP